MTFPTSIERIVFIPFENHSYSNVIANGPYFKELANIYGRIINDNEICNPSLPSYLATTCGSTENKCGTDRVSIIDTKNIFSLVESVGLKWDAYAEGWNGSCSSPGGMKFAVRHCPQFFYKNTVQNPTPGYCQAHFHTLADWFNLINANGIPSNFVYITPNLCNDAHDCSIQTADNWLKNVLNLPNLLTKPWAQKTVFIIWWDEGYGSGRYVVFVSPISKGTSVTLVNSKDGDYRLLTTMEWLLGLGTCGNNDDPIKYPPLKGLFQAGPSPLSVTLAINPNTIVIGQSATFTATTSGGTPPYTYTWSNLPLPCQTSNTNAITCTPDNVGIYNITVTVKDMIGATTTANGTLTVNSIVTKYRCTGSPNFQCVADPNGPYNTLAECQTACKPPVTKYRCTGSPDFQCIVDPNGPYASLAECQNACKAPSPGSITVTTPSTGLIYRKGESRVIRWNSAGSVGPSVKIELLKANTVIKIVTSDTPNDGQMAWTVPSVTSGTDYTVKITSKTNAQIFGISGKFTIK